MPVDVIETSATIDQETLRQKGVLGSAIMDGRTTMIMDIYELVETVHPEWGGKREQHIEVSKDVENAILLAEDSDFFRNQIIRYLEGDGHKVLAAEDGQAAWELLQKNVDKVRLVLTDIEMPRMDGLGLTRAIRADQRFAGLPIIALTSLAGEDDISRGKQAGITEYQIKLDREKLLEGVRHLLKENVKMGTSP